MRWFDLEENKAMVGILLLNFSLLIPVYPVARGTS